MGRARDYLISHPSAVCGGQFYMERTEHMAVNKITHSWNEDYTGLILPGASANPRLLRSTTTVWHNIFRLRACISPP